MELQEIIKKTHRLAAALGYAIFGLLIFYLVMEELIRNRLHPFLGFYRLGNIPFIRYLFYSLAVVSLILARVLQGILLKKKAGDTPLDLVNKLHRTSLILVILSELPALFGLALFLLAGLNLDFYVLLAVSAIVLFIFFPRRRVWEEWISEKA
ncbi:MAG: hypothetical protein ACPLZD_04585 [Candidatus Saccharicenans sp.]|nr:MAG: hypothetical protein C0168_07920 [Candidatus Aminicenantes bacterium]HEK84992.1 hypothetical protein [Candidatus Aminicenantes bacterium]